MPKNIEVISQETVASIVNQNRGVNLSPVISQGVTDPPPSPDEGDRYLIPAGATGEWAVHEDDIAQWDGAEWDYTDPAANYTIYVSDEELYYIYSNGVWGTFPLTLHADTHYRNAVDELPLATISLDGLCPSWVYEKVLASGYGQTWRGEWLMAETYDENDLVEYDGNCYIAVVANIGDPPPGSSWELLCSKGDVGPAGPQGEQGIQGPIGPQGPPGDKYAIIEIPEGSGRYYSMVTVEAPEVLFMDRYSCRFKRNAIEARCKLDGKLIRSCEPGSIQVVSSVSTAPVMIGAEIDGNVVRLRANRYVENLSVNFVVMGTRLGRERVRFQRRTKRQFESNQRFWTDLLQGKFHA